MENLRAKIIEALIRVEEGSYSTLLLDSILTKIEDKRDKSLFTEIYYGVIRNKLYLDYIINYFSNTPIKKMDKEVLTGLRIGTYQLLFLDKVPARAAIYESVEGVKELLGKNRKGAVSFTNGILRAVNRDIDQVKLPDFEKNPIKYLSIKYSYPRWIINNFINQYGMEKAEKILKAGNKRAKVIYRHNVLKMSRKEFIAGLENENIIYEKTFLDGFYRLLNIDNPAETDVFKKGGAYIQGTSAGLASLLLGVEKEMEVLDLAAAPGGKTTHMAELMKNRGVIKALDINQSRLNLVKENAERLGVSNIVLINADAANYEDNNKYDRILADLPCSGLGLISAKPEIKWEKDEAAVDAMAQLQFKILSNNLAKLKSGGKMLYSTCTLSREENQKLVERLISENNDIILEDLNIKFKKITGLDINNKGKCLEILPGFIDSEGFFYALFKKTESELI
ncbi:MAG: 16S rRNA (cytosine(967)-C(5))-methyltransferase RsmB [Halanaerobium sp.]